MKHFFTPVLLTLTLSLALPACSSGGGTPSLTKFASCHEMSNYLQTAFNHQIEFAKSNAPGASEPTAATNDSAASPLEEGDITKIEDGILVTKNRHTLDIFDISNPSSMRKTASIQIPNEFLINELILKNKILLVITSSGLSTRIISYNLSSSNPEKIKELELTASYAQVRVSANQDRAILVLNSEGGDLRLSDNLNVAPNSSDDSIPNINALEITTNLLGQIHESSISSAICKCEDVSYISDAFDPISTVMTHFISISLDKNSTFKQELSFLGSSPVLRATSDAFLLAVPMNQSMDNGENNSTHLILARDESGGLKAKAETRTEGFLKEQFNLNVAGDYVYAFTSLVKKSEYAYSDFVPAETVLKTFQINGNHLKLVNTSKGIGQNEFLFSSLFTNKLAYAVTFKKTDPFYVFDLSSAAKPEILGELKIDGHSRQLREVSDTQVLAIGRDAEDQGDFALYQGVQVSLFEMNSKGSPSLKDRKIFGDRATRSDAAGGGYWSIGDESYKSYFYDQENQVLLLPTSFNADYGSEESAQHTLQIFGISDRLNQQSQISGFTSYVDRVVNIPNSYLAVSNTEIVSLSKEAPIHILQKLQR